MRILTLMTLLLLIAVPVHITIALSLSPSSSPQQQQQRRRHFLQQGGRRLLLLAGGSGTTATVALVSQPSHAAAARARGAAELDLEYYMRDLVGGNKPEGTVSASKPPPVPPPRTIKDPLRSLLLNDDCTVDCLSTLTLLDTLSRSIQFSDDPRRLEKSIKTKMISYRDRASTSFYTRAGWKTASVSDQYYFDLTSYALWRTAAELLPNFKDRDMFVRNLGRGIYTNIQKNYRFVNRKGNASDNNNNDGSSATTTTPLVETIASLSKVLETRPLKNGSLVGTITPLTELLDFFQSQGFIKGYRLGEQVKSKQDERPLFDSLDDEAIMDGASVDCLISIFEPATLGASLQITGEQSRFTPDFVGPTLAALWESAGIQSITWETFFVDPEYRPNPKDYFPNEQLFQFSLAAR